MKHIYYRFSVPDSEYDELIEAISYGTEHFLKVLDRLHGNDLDREGENSEDPSIRH